MQCLQIMWRIVRPVFVHNFRRWRRYKLVDLPHGINQFTYQPYLTKRGQGI